MHSKELKLHNMLSVFWDKAGNHSYASAPCWKGMGDAVRTCQGRCGHSAFLGVCGWKQVLSTFLKCHCCNTFTVASLEGGKGWLSHRWCAGTGSSMQPGWALPWGQLGFLTSACQLPQLSPGRALGPWQGTFPSVCSGFFHWLAWGFVSPKPARCSLKGLQHVCQISGFQVE